MDWLSTLVRWLHLTAAATIVGGFVYARLVVAASAAVLPASAIGRARRLWFSAVGVLLLTGIYNLITSISGKPPLYHALLTLKILLALHVFSIAILTSVPPGVNPGRDARRPRLMAGAVISGVVILLLSAILRRGF